ncbi:SDR family oxidoreductase [Solicola sp. PLA-1-18]|uniref:SDR family oxidoreductase n=1 Tax=Solicola sp. PLA-1-18 TaxID=3380532 RepID=UPI003B80FF2F
MRRRTLITGASSGLGAGMARHLAARGHDLALTARRVDRLEALRDELVAAHPDVRVVVHALDVDDHQQVFDVVAAAADDLGGLDRVVVNAGLGKGARVGSGRFDANRDTLMTNAVAGLAQCEAAMEHFYDRGAGHLVLVSSQAAFRGLPGSQTAYSASKAAVAHLAEGIRMDLMRRGGHDIAVTTLFPGYIVSEMNDVNENEVRLMTGNVEGTRAMVDLIEREVAEASVPRLPWAPLGLVLRHAPLQVLRRIV